MPGRIFSASTLDFLRRKGSEGGKKAAASMTPEQRTARAKKAALSGTPEKRSERARNAVSAREAARKTKQPLSSRSNDDNSPHQLESSKRARSSGG